MFCVPLMFKFKVRNGSSSVILTPTAAARWITISVSFKTLDIFSDSSKSHVIKLTSSKVLKTNYRADILDRNGNFIVKTINTVDIGINPKLVIDKKKLLINLKLIFPNKNFNKIKKKLDKNKFFYLEKKVSQENYEKLRLLGDKSIIPEEKFAPKSDEINNSSNSSRVVSSIFFPLITFLIPSEIFSDDFESPDVNFLNHPKTKTKPPQKACR